MKELLPCPFCGGSPNVKYIGNDFTKKRSIIIQCTNCHAQRTDGAIRFGMDWLKNISFDRWNRRVKEQKDA